MKLDILEYRCLSNHVLHCVIYVSHILHCRAILIHFVTFLTFLQGEVTLLKFNNKFLHKPAVSADWEWSGSRIKLLCGQGKMYVHLQSATPLEDIANSADDDIPDLTPINR